MYMNPTINPQATGLQVFYNSETGINLRTQVVNNESWFIAQDTCNILGLNNITKAMAALDFDEKHGVTISNAVGNNQEVRAVNESGLYHLIFISRKSEAKAFRKWVANVVLPSIRRTGSYSSTGIQTPLEEPSKKLPSPKHRPFFENWQNCVSPHLSEREGHIVASELGVSYSHVRKVFMGTSVSERVARALTEKALENKRRGVKYGPQLPIYEQLSLEWDNEEVE